MIDINLFRPKQFFSGKKSGHDAIDINVPFPSEWNDLTHKELYYAASIFFQKDTSPYEARAKIFRHYLTGRVESQSKIENHKPLPSDYLSLLNLDDIATRCLDHLDFLFIKNDRTVLPEPFRIQNINYVPVEFDHITCGEFEDCEAIAPLVAKDPSLENLTAFAAILFRPSVRASSTPEPYMTYNQRTRTWNTYAAAQKQKYFTQQSPEMLYAAFIWYVGCRAQLPTMFPTIYEGSKDQSGQPDMLVFTKCIHAGAGPKNGSRNDIRVMELLEFLFDMEQEAIHAKKMEEEYAKIQQ